MIPMTETNVELALERFRRWVDSVLAIRPELSVTSWAVGAGLAATTVTRRYNPKPGAAPSRPKRETLSALARYAGVLAPDLDSDNTQAIPAVGEFIHDKDSINSVKKRDHISVIEAESPHVNSLKGVGSSPPGGSNSLAPSVRMIPVVGVVRAGAFMEVLPTEYIDEDTRRVPFPSRRHVDYDIKALDVEGDSCNLKYPSGCTVFYASPDDVPLKNGKFVVVQRPNSSGQVETTVKQFFRQPDGTVELRPRSTNSKYQSVFLPKYNPDSQDNPEITGVVIGKYVDEDDDTD